VRFFTFGGCSFFVPAYDNPISNEHEKEKERPEGVTPPPKLSGETKASAAAPRDR